MPSQTVAARLLALAKANKYKRGGHREKDKVKDGRKHNDKTKQNHGYTLRRYVLWHLGEIELDHEQRGLPLPDEADVCAQCLRRGVEVPDLATVKDFFRFYVATSHPRINDVPTADSICSIAEFFFAGFTRVTETIVSGDMRSEVYSWIREDLTAEGLVVNKHKPKHNFTVTDLTRILVTAWTKDDLIFTPERYRLQFTYIIRVFCWTGARIGAFFTGGLRYRDITLVLQRTTGALWKFIYRLDQRWVKNNRDPENIVFGTALQEQEKFVYDDVSCLLTMALLDKALWGFDTWADLQEQRIPEGQNEVVLRWKEEALNKPILRKCTQGGGVTDEPMPRDAFSQIFQSTLRNAGYFGAATVHSIRRGIGQKVNKIYTEVERSQHLTQADPRIFGQAYVANTSSVDGQGAFLGEALNHEHIEFFQGLGLFREPGLPCELPARLEHELKQKPRFQELEEDLRRCPRGCPTALKHAKQLLTSYWKTLRRVALYNYQEKWVQERRDWQVLTRGRKQRDDLCRADLVEILFLLFPERRRLAQKFASDNTMTSDERWLAMEDMYTLCTRDFSVLYLPGHQPVNGRCPVECCRFDLGCLPEGERNQHIQACVRRKIASKRGYSQEDVHYCYHCFNWVVGREEWEEHCQTRINDWASKRCGKITYRRTLVRPAYCPFCLEKSDSASGRLKSWCRDCALWEHVDTKHLQGCEWPMPCPHPLCDVSLSNGLDLRFHFIDDHGLSRKAPKRAKNLGTIRPDPEEEEEPVPPTKRKALNDSPELSWPSPEQFSPTYPPKKVKRGSSTVAPSLLSSIDPDKLYPTSPIDLTGPDSSTYASEATPPLWIKEDDQSEDCVNLRSPSPPPVRFQSYESTIVDDDIFSQFIRSPSPEDTAIALTIDQVHQPVVDIDDIVSPSTACYSENGENGENSLSRHDSKQNCPPDVPLRTRPKLQIRLRVEPPKPKIRLRVSAPKTRESNKRLCPPKKCEGTRRQRSQKKG